MLTYFKCLLQGRLFQVATRVTYILVVTIKTAMGNLCKIRGSHSGGYEECHLLGYNAV
jgi:hypothetical protein